MTGGPGMDKRLEVMREMDWWAGDGDKRLEGIEGMTGGPGMGTRGWRE